MRVELGAGARAHDGFVAVDVNPHHADVVADALALPFADATVQALRAVDVLEHISYRDSANALVEWARVCVSGAPLYVQVPDAAEIMRWFSAGDRRLERTADGPCTLIHGAQWRMLGGHADGRYDDGGDWRWNAHYSMWDRESLKAVLAFAGFTIGRVRTNEHPNLLCWAVRT